MLNQSFSAENFRKILDYENRKGVYLEGRFFPEIVLITDEIKRLTAEIKSRRPFIDEATFKLLLDKRQLLKDKKEIQLTNSLERTSENVISGTFECKLNVVTVPGWKPIYKVDANPETYFTIKQVQKNIYDLYKVKQSNRVEIVTQLKNVLDDSFPKVIVRTDIKDFYETVSHSILLKRINEENLLDFLSKKVIRNLLHSYSKITGNSKGIPRGVGVSAYLAELYMKDIDKEIQALPNLVYFARYVDDIIIIFTPNKIREETNYLKIVRQIVESPNYQLHLNLSKSKEYSMVSSVTDINFTFLGYSVGIAKDTNGFKPIKVRLSDRKIEKYKMRITASLEAYNRESKHDQVQARRMLLSRMRFLTTNTKLINNKSNIIVGVYYSNTLLNDLQDLEHLDNCVRHHVFRKIIQPKLQRRLLKFSFVDGFKEKRFTSFRPNQFIKILSIWRSR